MKKVTLALGVLLLGLLIGLHVRSVEAQAATPVFQITGAWSAHTSCTPTTGQTTLCIASDGLFISINGGAFAPAGGAGGVTSVTVNGGTAQTGAVTLTIPTTATTTATTTLK